MKKLKVLVKNQFKMKTIYAEGDNTDTSWMLLLESIKDALKSKDIDKNEVSKILSGYKSREKDWLKYAFFDEKDYTRNLIETDNRIYILSLLTWNPSQGSPIHSHPNSICFVKMLAGSLREIRYEAPQEGKEFKVIRDCMLGRNEVSCIDASMGAHEMRNDTQVPAVSLHLYIPPFDVCHKYDRTTAATIRDTMTFNSLYGKICDDAKFPEGHIQSDAN